MGKKHILRIFIITLVLCCLCGLFTVNAFELAENEISQQQASETTLTVGETQETQTESSTEESILTAKVKIIYAGVEISWEDNKDAVNYKLYYKRSTWDYWKELETTSENSFVDTGHTPGITYCYSVVGYDGSGKAVTSFDETGTSFETPQGVNISYLQNTLDGIDLRWDAYEGAVGYRVYYRNESWKAKEYSYLTTVYNKTSLMDTGTTGRIYSYSIQALDKDDNPISTLVCGGPIVKYAKAPKIYMIKGSGDKANIYWDSINGADHYQVYYKRSVNKEWKKLVSTKDNMCTDTNFAEGYIYQYTVESISSNGIVSPRYEEGILSYNDFRKTTNVIPDAVTTPSYDKLKMNPLSNEGTGLKISWQKNENVKAYQLYYKRDYWDYWKKLIVTDSDSYIDTGHTPEITYVYSVQGIDDLGNAITKPDNEGLAFTAPESVNITSITNTLENGIHLEWDKYDDAVSYAVYYRRSNWDYWKKLTETTDASLDDTGTCGIDYYYSIAALDSNGKNISTFDNIGKLIECLHTPKVTSIDNESGQVVISWNKIAGTAKYQVYYTRDDFSSWIPFKTSTTNSCTDSGFHESHIYSYTVKAIGEKNQESAMYLNAFVKYIDVKAPVLERSSTVNAFHWAKVPGATSYEIYCSVDKGSYKYIDSTKSEYYSKSGLSNGHLYYWKVKPIITDDKTVVCMSPPLRICAGMCTPGGVELTSQLWKITLTWDRENYAQGYDIYRSTSESGTFSKFESTPKLYANTGLLSDGQRYYFRIVPYRYEDGYKVEGSYTTYSKVCTSDIYGEYIGRTYVEVNISQQHMWFYKGGSLITDCDVVTGNYGTADTPKGIHTVFQKLSPATLVGEGYSTPVSYWMAFTYDGCGIHDATWRDEFGGDIYKGNGSHGCVNTPYDDVRTIYNNLSVGTYVVVH